MDEECNHCKSKKVKPQGVDTDLREEIFFCEDCHKLFGLPIQYD